MEATTVCFTRFGVLRYLDSPDALAERHNLRMEVLRMLDAAAHNREQGDALSLKIARRQEREAEVLLAEIRDTFNL